LKKKFFLELSYLFFLGVFSTLSLPPFGFFFINFITFSLLFIFLAKKEKSKNLYSFMYGWMFGFGYFFSSLYWISISLTFDSNFKFLIPFSLFLIPAFLALFYGFISLIFLKINLKNISSSFFLLVSLFGILEFLRGHILTGFPWNLIAFSFSNYPNFLSVISVIGTHSFNIICISLFFLPALLYLKNDLRNKFVCGAFLFLVIIFNFYGYYYSNSFQNIKIIKKDFQIRAIASNFEIKKFYNDISTEKIIRDLIKISDPSSTTKKTLFLWPESIIPGITKDQFKDYNYLFNKSFNEEHQIALGIISKSQVDSEKIFNSLAFFDTNLNLLHSYEKISLVPFGEFLPLESILKRFGFKTLTNNYKSFSPGKNKNVINLKIKNSYLKILPLICYEIIYSGRIQKIKNYDFIINISEDGWFGKSIGPKQHFAHSIFRAIENGKYVIRSSNNGMTAIINPIGIIEKKIDYGQDGYIEFSDSKIIKSTLFSKYGNKIFGFIILLYIFLIFSFNRFKNE